MTKVTKTIPEIKAEADAKIWKAVRQRLVTGMEQQDIAKELEVSASWLSRYMNKNAAKVKADPKIPRWQYRSAYY